jgi:general secretion pathway protein A
LYQGFYGLKESPFRLSPDPAFMCMVAQHQEALSGLIYSICTHPGLTVLLGEAGTGKTTLLYSLLGLLEKRQFVTALCTNPTLTREEFYDHLLMKFGVDCPSPLKSRQLAALEATFTRHRQNGKPCVLIVDEAQRLPVELLEEIRLLMNLETPKEKLLEIIIAGQPELQEVLRRPELRQLKQRVGSICRLQPLNVFELKEYLHHRVVTAGLPSQSLFSEELIQAIHEYTRGIPRLVNSLCDAALQTGFALQQKTITREVIDEAARDLDLTKAGAVEPASAKPAMVKPVAVKPAAPVEEEIEPSPAILQPVAVNGTSARTPIAPRVPLESYASRQKSLNFFANLMDRLR